MILPIARPAGIEQFSARAPAGPDRLRKRLVPDLEAAEYRPAHQLETDMIYELRIYSCLPGRLPALLKRFETATIKIWEKHGIKQAGFWTVLIGDGNHDLYYFIAWESLADREKKWTAFQADPAWIAARAESERDGPILANVKSMLMTPTAFSSVK